MSPSSGVYCVLYYGTPLPNSKPLSSLKGIVVSQSPSAAGSGSVQAVFPKGSGKLVGYSCYVTASYVEIQIQTSVGELLTFFDTTNEVLELRTVTPLDIPLAQTFSVNYTAGGALTFYAFFYYQ
ncbi:MAG: hypothetical protein QW429_04970 [Thermoprotei archaeon]